MQASFVAAGGADLLLPPKITYDPAWRSYGPGIATAIAGIEESFTLGETRVDLGHGRFEYKRELGQFRPTARLAAMFPPAERDTTSCEPDGLRVTRESASTGCASIWLFAAAGRRYGG